MNLPNQSRLPTPLVVALWLLGLGGIFYAVSFVTLASLFHDMAPRWYKTNAPLVPMSGAYLLALAGLLVGGGFLLAAGVRSDEAPVLRAAFIIAGALLLLGLIWVMFHNPPYLHFDADSSGRAVFPPPRFQS